MLCPKFKNGLTKFGNIEMKVKIYSLFFLLAISNIGLTQEVSLNGTPKNSRMGFYFG